MKNLKRNYSESGQGLVVVIILLVLLIGGWVWLRSNKATMDREARDFGRQVIESLSVRHDIGVFRDHLSPQGRLDYPPSRQQDVIGLFNQLGTPNQPIKIEENVTFESGFFSPRGFFTAQLQYPTRTAMLQIAVSHPVGKWQVDDLTFNTGPQQ